MPLVAVRHSERLLNNVFVIRGREDGKLGAAVYKEGVAGVVIVY